MHLEDDDFDEDAFDREFEAIDDEDDDDEDEEDGTLPPLHEEVEAHPPDPQVPEFERYELDDDDDDDDLREDSDRFLV